MKQTIFILFVIISLNNCSSKGQIIENKKFNNKMKTFDIHKFNQNKNFLNGNNYYKYEDGGKIITLIETDNSYVEIESKKNENFTTKTIYNKKNYTLKSSQTFLLDMPIGTYKEYDENAKIIKEINYEPKYSFSILQLVDKIKNDFGIDITKKKERLTIGIQESETPYFFIRYPIDDIRKNTYKFIKINANTGALISENVAHDIE